MACSTRPCGSRRPVATQFIQNRPNPGPPRKAPHRSAHALRRRQPLHRGRDARRVAGLDPAGADAARRLRQHRLHRHLPRYLPRQAQRLRLLRDARAACRCDARYSPAGGEDFNWNAVWESRTALRGTDWVAEMRIPYSAIRFSKAARAAVGRQLYAPAQARQPGVFLERGEAGRGWLREPVGRAHGRARHQAAAAPLAHALRVQLRQPLPATTSKAPATPPPASTAGPM